MITQQESKETITTLLNEATQGFKSAGFEAAELEARFLLSGFLGAATTSLILKADETLSKFQIEKFQEMVRRRIKREPAAYIIGNANFMGFHIQVDERVLIPRPETELLVEEALRELNARRLSSPKILEVGAGSGCVSIALGRAIPKASLLAVDVSLGALKVAQVNIRENKLTDRINLLLSDCFGALQVEKTGGFDMIVSNPPYVASKDLARLEPELSFEPRQALDGGPDGLRILRRLIEGAPKFLKPQGVLVMEIGYDQGVLVKDLLEKGGFKSVSILKDYGGNDRIVKGTFSGPV